MRLKAEGRDTLDVWYGSVWYSTEYEFNDRGRVLGINPDYLFAQDAVARFFETVQKLHAEKVTDEVVDGITEVAKAAIRRDSSVAHYKKLLAK
ncbi:hypothetical protein [Noviherbaspirillum pedocola]|uniref:Uncharacterized protein n=1 Tax=Noviherbaspirillum pedocola TaxID=2801341 RepID=A0A934T1I9_9BURK|nr:hypothetical protein [Noviherbaspirillum pedocola]MBK4737312.1 hypothetical protein [Noviherbaspirillum pedocola]